LLPGPEPDPSGADTDEGDFNEGDSDECDSDYDEDMIEPPDPFAALDPAGLPEDVQVATCASLVINWLGVSKAPWVSGQDVWTITETVCQRVDFPVFGRVKKLVKDYLDGRMVRIGMCTKGHVAYYDCTHPKLQAPQFQNADEDCCRVCGEAKYLPLIRLPDGSCAPRQYLKEFYYLPIKHWLQDLFRRPDLAPHLANDAVGQPGSVRRSHGYKRKVLDNPIMAQDHRNQALIATADGIPCFKNKNASRGVVPVMLRTTMPDGIGLDVRNVHMVALVPDQHWVVHPESGRKKRSKRKTGFLTAITLVMTDELLHLYETGVMVVDHALPLDDVTRVFRLFVILLYWIGDYPGIGEAAGTMSSGGRCCHWCKQHFPFNYALHRTQHCEFRPFLPMGDPLRKANRAADCDWEVPLRTHQQMCEDAEASEAFEGAYNAAAHPRFQSGVSYVCPLAYLPMWDMVWDFLADFMHILEGYIKRHMLEVMKGGRYPAPPALVPEDANTARSIRRYPQYNARSMHHSHQPAPISQRARWLSIASESMSDSVIT